MQHIYERYGRDRAAKAANVNTYRTWMAMRDVARALGYSPGQVDAWTRHIGHHEPIPDDVGIPEHVAQFVYRLFRLPRHLSIHFGGMVLFDRQVGVVCPCVAAELAGRRLRQW